MRVSRSEDAFACECRESFEQVFEERVHQPHEEYRVSEVLQCMGSKVVNEDVEMPVGMRRITLPFP